MKCHLHSLDLRQSERAEISRRQARFKRPACGHPHRARPLDQHPSDR